MPALQRTEARIRARLVQVRGYRIDLDLTRGGEVFGSSTVIRFGCTEPGAATFLDLRPAALHRVVLNGRELDPAELDGNRLALTGLAAENELLIEAEMRYSRTGEGLHRFTDPADGAVYVYAACGPDSAPRVFACFDQPDLKATFELTVTAPADWTVLGNGSGERTGELTGERAGEPAGESRWEFAPTPPVSTYLFTVVAGPLHSRYAEHDGIPLGLHSRRSLAADLDREAEEIFEVTRASFDRLHQLFDERYPFGGYDQAFVPEFNWGAMENPGCVTFREELLFHSAPTEAERGFRAVVIAHEMAHMWFGDLVTMRWWDDLWLNESFAEYLGYRIAAESTPFTGSWTSFGVKRKGWGYDADQRATTHPIAATGVESLAEAMVNFDGIAYAKGASALRQLVAWLGDESFFAGINEHFARHRFGNAELAEFLDALAEVSGRDVHGWAERWLRTSGVDTLRLSVGYQGEQVVSAELVPDGTRPHRVGIGVYELRDGGEGSREGGVPVLRERFEVEVEPGRPTPLPKLVGAPRAALLLPNHGDLTWARIRLDEDSWRTVGQSLSRLEDPLARAVLWENARDLVRDAELPPARYLDLVEAQLPGEPVDAVVEAVLTFARTKLIAAYLAPEERPAAGARLGEVCRRLSARPDAGDGLRLAALRGAIDNAATPEQLAELEAWLADGGPSGPLSTELRWSALVRLAAEGLLDERRIAAELAADPSSSAHEGAAQARSALPSPEAKAAAWQQLFTEGALSNYLLVATAQGFWQSGSERLQQEYIQRYFAELPAAGRRGDMVARVLGGALFPAGRSEPQTVQVAERCLAGEELTPGLRRVLADQVDDLRRAVRVRVR
ncbi:aminopeptidase N [Kitasatospora sp. GP82]|uniref:aminopeptidase N n=1 Tax=Kitasatospora sp. GP82 TaxID=3035089 RepID=UPI0024730892|nr:aminopeptidase N [Kitasatospora sp. GP82]